MSAYLSHDDETEAVDLVRALCAVAGNEDAVFELLSRYANGKESKQEACVGVASALLVTYARGLAGPISLDDQGEPQ